MTAGSATTEEAISSLRGISHFSSKLLAESLGSFAIVLFGCGAIMVNEISKGAIGHIGISLIVGLVVGILITLFGSLSGAHFNPAITIGFLFMGRFSLKATLPYLMAQFIGALAGASVLKFIFGEVANLGATRPAGSMIQSFSLELLMTMFLILVIATMSSRGGGAQHIASALIGATITLEVLVAGPISGASMNPARSFGPAMVSGDLSSLWIYILAPIFGSLLGALLFKLLRSGESR